MPDKIIESSCYIDGNNLIIKKGKAGKTVKVDDSAKYIKQAINDLKIENNSLELLTEDSTPKEIDLDAVYNEIHKKPVNAYYSQNPYVVHPSENGMDFSITLDEAKNMLKRRKRRIYSSFKSIVSKCYNKHDWYRGFSGFIIRIFNKICRK